MSELTFDEVEATYGELKGIADANPGCPSELSLSLRHAKFICQLSEQCAEKVKEVRGPNSTSYSITGIDLGEICGELGKQIDHYHNRPASQPLPAIEPPIESSVEVPAPAEAATDETPATPEVVEKPSGKKK